MIGTPSYPFTIPTFGGSSSKSAPSGAWSYTTGYTSGQALPAEHLNYFFGDMTANLNTIQTNQTNIAAELDYVLTSAGITPSGASTTQVKQSLDLLYAPLATAQFNNIVTSSTSPITIAASTNSTTYILTTGASTFTINLPSAATVVGQQFKIIKADSGAGAIAIAPNSTDIIGQAGNVTCYLGKQFQELHIVSSASGQWIVLGGQLMPSQSVDTNGSQYHLGKLIHLPLDNNITRLLSISYAVGFSSAQQCSGLYGIPSNAVGGRFKIEISGTSAAAGSTYMAVAFTNNNSYNAYAATCHPFVQFNLVATAAGQIQSNYQEIDIPFNSSGQIYAYVPGGSVNMTPGTIGIYLVPVGYYMGN